MRTVTLAWCFIFVLLTFATQPQEEEHHHDEEEHHHDEITQEEEDHQRGGLAFPVETKVFNAFPDVNITAFVIFEEERISRLAYGHFIIARPMLEIQADFVIQFRKIPKEEVIGGYTEFGFTQEELSEGAELLMVIRRGEEDTDKPKHDLVIFSHNDVVEPDSSKLYIYNAVWRRDSVGKGLYFYGLYLRRNYDGSQSESITQLAADIPTGEGREINLQPETNVHIKAFYTTVKSVSTFKLEEAIVSFEDFRASAGRREYLVAYGDYHSPDSPPGMELLKVAENSALSGTSLPILAFGMISVIKAIVL